MTTERDIEARLKKLQAKRDRIRSDIQRESGRLAAQRRKRRTRAMIMLGGAVRAAAEKGALSADMLDALRAFIAERDLALVNEFVSFRRAPARPQAASRPRPQRSAQGPVGRSE